MSLNITVRNIDFGIGDRIRISQEILEGEKKRIQSFEGIVISIKGSKLNKMFTVRRIGEAQIGIEKIFPATLSTIKEIKIIKKGMEGANRAKLYYIRNKSKREIDRIYSRTSKKTSIRK